MGISESSFNDYPEYISKILKQEDGTWKKVLLKKRSFNPGFVGYLPGKKTCNYCEERHKIMGCPYRWFYEELVKIPVESKVIKNFKFSL